MLPTACFSRPTRLATPARGLTLIELMITMAIIGILAAVVYPMYSKYVPKAHRAAAQSHMMDMASRQGQIVVDSNTYASQAELLAILPTPDSVNKNYVITVDTPAGARPTYKITATPRPGSKQVGDGILTLDYAGVKEPAGKW